LLIVLGLAAALIAPAALARSSFSGNACTLASARQIAALGIKAGCKPTSVKTPGFDNNLATWGNLAAPHVSIGVNTYPSTSSSTYQVALKSLAFLPGGSSKKVSGIGSVAYESGANGSTLSAINFVVGKQIVNIELRTAGGQKSFAALDKLSKAVEAKL
jgi:hypothetical protein